MQFNYFQIEQDKHIDMSTYIPIAVITSFQKDGKFIPLKAQLETTEGLIILDIKQIHRSEEKEDYVQFDCSYSMEDHLIPLRMYYMKKQHQWVISK